MPGQLKDSEKKALVAIIKPNKKKFYKALWKWYGERGLLLGLANTQTSPIKSLLHEYPQNYGYVSELNIIYLAILNDLWSSKLQGVIGPRQLIYIHKKYWERFHKYYVFPRTRKKIALPHMNKTQAIKEFLARGFVHKDDAVDWRGKKYTIECNIAPLVWPQGFEQHMDSCRVAKEVGINGYTSCPIPK